MSIEEQIYLLICKYAKKEKVVSSLGGRSAENYDDLEQDFIHNAYVCYMYYAYPSYDSNRSKISTHLYRYLNWYYMSFVLMSKHQISFKKSKDLLLTKNDNLGKIINAVSLTEIIENDKGDEFCADSFLEDKSIKPSYICANDSNIINVFIDSVNRYVNNFRRVSKNKERDKTIIISYILYKDYGITYQNLGNKYNITRECVQQIIKKYTNWAVKDPKLRTAFNK